MRFIRIFIFTVLILVASGYWLVARPLFAQTNPTQLLITWQAQNYVPSAYRGKNLPIANTPVALALELIDGQKIADISKKEIRWLTNNQLIKSGIGLKNITLIMPAGAGDQYIKAVITNYLGKNLEKFIIIPITIPEVVINAPYPDKKIISGVNALTALPYFFNSSSLADLAFNWLANNQTVTDASGSPDILSLDTSGGRTGDQIVVSLGVSNIKNDLEFARQTSVLEIK